MKRLLLLTVLLLMSFGSVFAQDDCEPLSDAAQLHFNLRDERVGKLSDLMQEIIDEGFTEDGLIEMAYWVVMADSAAAQSGEVEYPDCKFYSTLDEVYNDILGYTYSVSTQMYLLSKGQLSKVQQTNVAALFKDDVTDLSINIEIWKFAAEKIND